MSAVAGSIKPWYKEWLVWLVIALPLSSVVAGISTVIIAVRGADTLVADDYYKEGLAYNQNRERDAKAAALGISVSLLYDHTTHIVTLVPNSALNTSELLLSFFHPAGSDKDIQIELKATSNQLFEGQLAQPLSATSWRVVLEPQDKSWRIYQRWQGDDLNSLHLAAVPAVDGQ